MKPLFESVTIDRQVVDTAVGRRFPDAARVDEPPQTRSMARGKRALHIGRRRGESLRLCASLSPEYLCCATHVLRALSNCPYDCTYCFLPSYLTNSTLTVVADIRALVEEVREKIRMQPRRFFRIGTWELGDSLALEEITGAAAELIAAFAQIPSALLELRTKSDRVDTILDLDHRGRTVVSWTLGPAEVAEAEEPLTAPLEKRLSAMEKTVARGYLTALHFDPIIEYRGWQSGYETLVRSIFDAVPPERVAWVSIGGLRFKPEMKRSIEERFPKSRITSAEIVLGPDGKMRYVKPKRIALFGFLKALLDEHGKGKPFVYLCMERWDVWEQVLGYRPDSTGHLDFLIARSLFERYRGLVHEPPVIEHYLRGGP